MKINTKEHTLIIPRADVEALEAEIKDLKKKNEELTEKLKCESDVYVLIRQGNYHRQIADGLYEYNSGRQVLNVFHSTEDMLKTIKSEMTSHQALSNDLESTREKLYKMIDLIVYLVENKVGFFSYSDAKKTVKETFNNFNIDYGNSFGDR